jgi:proline dehydrogenase
MTLGRLDQREGAALAQRVVKGKALPTEVLNAIIDHADGVPLFVEELTKDGSGRRALAGGGRPLRARGAAAAARHSVHLARVASSAPRPTGIK